jgi:hypothetical protein
LSWPIKEKKKEIIYERPTKKIMRGQHVELASKKKEEKERDNI